MRRKASHVAAALTAAATLSLAAASPAQAQPPCASTIPPVDYVCHVLGDPVGEVVRLVYCTFSPWCR